MKSVLVTGATGFVGRHALDSLVKRNYKVYATFSEKKPTIQSKNIFWHHVNLHEAAAVESLLQETRPSHLLHLAWYAKPGEFWASPLNLQWLTSSIHLLNTFIRMDGQRAVFVGSCAEYDWSYSSCKEFFTPCKPETLYGTAKYALYLLTEAMAKQQQVSLAWGRLFYLFGADEYPQRLVPAAINSLINQKNFQVKNGNQVRDFMYVRDVADALVTLLDTEVNGPVNIASGKPVAIRELMSLIAHKLQDTRLIQYQDDGSSDAPHNILTADVTRLLTEVKWQPQYTLDAALDETISWWSNVT